MTSLRLLAAVLFMARPAMAADATTFDSCTDAGGRVVPAEADYGQAALVRTTDAAGQPTIRYNPGVLPRLTFGVRQFFYAHECARHAMGDAGKPALSAARARQADCVGLSALLASGLMRREDIAGLQGQLNFTDAEWQLLPGPPRQIDFAGCRTGNALRLPSPATPSARQGEWNACARACGDRLWTCQKDCRGAACDTACMKRHRQCESACGANPD